MRNVSIRTPSRRWKQLKDLVWGGVKQTIPLISEFWVGCFSDWVPLDTLTGQLCGVDKETGNDAKW